MNLIKQLVVGIAVVAGVIAIWIAYVPSAAPFLERAGVYDLLGMEPPATGEETGGGRSFGGGAALVVVSEVVRGQVNAQVSAIGDGRAIRSVTVRSETTGMIRNLPVTPGSYVEPGALVAQLENEAERIALERARLVVANASGDVERLSQLGSSGTVAAARIREAELALRTAQLEVEQAEFDLQQRRITAPIAGWVGLLEAEQGERISAQDVIAVITDRSSLQIEFRVPERFINELSVGMPMQVTALAHPDQPLEGEIGALDNVVDRASRTLRVQGNLENRNDRLRVGQAFSVTLSFPGEDLPAVDPLAIQWSGEGSFVWVARDGEATREPVVIRQRNSDSVLVEGALELGDLVIIEGVQTLRPGATVEIVTGAALKAPPAAAAARQREL